MPRSFDGSRIHGGILHQACLVLLAATMVLASEAMAQYESMPVDEAAKRYGVSRARRYARSPSGDEAERTAFGKFIKDYYLPSMTQSDPASLADLGKLRYDYVRNFLWSAAPQVQEDLTKLTFAEMSNVVRGSFHPAVRYNAMLMIGQLDAKYEQQGSPPQPLPDANAFLTRYVAAGIDTERAPAPMIVGALIGLERHAKTFDQLPAANKSATVAALLKVLQKDEFPHEISSSVGQWIKVIAARGLAGIGELGDDNSVHKALMAVIGDEKARLNTRVRVAELLEAFKPAYASATGLDERATVQTLMQLATDIAADEGERASKYEDTMLGGVGRGSRTMRSSRTGGDTDFPDEYQLRRLLLRLKGLQKGIQAVQPAIKDQNLSGLLADVNSAVDPIIATASQEKPILLNLAGDVKRMASTVMDTSAALGVEAVEAPPENEEEAEEAMLEQETAGADGAATPPAS